jgi:hypothetical protein
MKRMILQIAIGGHLRCIAFAIWGCICVGSDTKWVWPVIMQMHTILYMFKMSYFDLSNKRIFAGFVEVASMRVTTNSCEISASRFRWLRFWSRGI